MPSIKSSVLLGRPHRKSKGQMLLPSKDYDKHATVHHGCYPGISINNSYLTRSILIRYFCCHCRPRQDSIHP